MSADAKIVALSDRAEESRRRILDVAAAAFAEHGYAGTSLNDLIKTTGLTKGGFYFHFESKEALALATLAHKKEQWAGRVISTAMREKRAIDQCKAMAFALCDVYESDLSYRVIGRLCMELIDQSPELAPQLRETFSTWVNLTASMLRSGQIEGDVRMDIDPAVAAEVAVAAFTGMTEMSFLASGGTDLRRRVEDFIDLFMAGLRPPT